MNKFLVLLAKFNACTNLNNKCVSTYVIVKLIISKCIQCVCDHTQSD